IDRRFPRRLHQKTIQKQRCHARYAHDRHGHGSQKEKPLSQPGAPMAVTRPNILNNAVARQKYTQGVNLLKNEFTGPTTQSLGIPGPSNKVSTYDLFVVWHQMAMMTLTPPTQTERNAAHSGPVFPPWHRFML